MKRYLIIIFCLILFLGAGCNIPKETHNETVEKSTEETEVDLNNQEEFNTFKKNYKEIFIKIKEYQAIKTIGGSTFDSNSVLNKEFSNGVININIDDEINKIKNLLNSYKSKLSKKQIEKYEVAFEKYLIIEEELKKENINIDLIYETNMFLRNFIDNELREKPEEKEIKDNNKLSDSSTVITFGERIEIFKEETNVKLTGKDVQFNMSNNLDKEFIVSGIGELHDYYNYGFEDEKNYFCVRLDIIDGKYSDGWYLYFHRDSFTELFNKLKITEIPMIVVAKIPEWQYKKGQGNMANVEKVRWFN